MTKILFVCLGNICRSPMAECIMKDMLKKMGLSDSFYISSGATSYEEEGNGIYPAAARKLKEMGIEVVAHRSRRICKSDYDDYDYILGMEERNVSAIKGITGGDPQSKVRRLLDFSDNPRNIADPWWTDDFDTAYRDITEGCNALLSYISTLKK